MRRSGHSRLEPRNTSGDPDKTKTCYRPDISALVPALFCQSFVTCDVFWGRDFSRLSGPIRAIAIYLFDMPTDGRSSGRG